MQQKRQTAYKFWIKDILNAEQRVTSDGMKYFVIAGNEAIRVNLIAIAINSYANPDKGYASVILDDTSGQVSVKAWENDSKMLAGVNMGDVVLVIGRPYMQDTGIFIRPEIVRKIDASWAKARNLELGKMFGKPGAPPSMIVEEVVEERIEPSTAAREKVIALIESMPEGIAVSELISKSGLREEDAEGAIEELVKEGEIFAPRPGYLKMI